MMFSKPRCSISRRKMPSAIGLLHVFPVQTNKIFIFIINLEYFYNRSYFVFQNENAPERPLPIIAQFGREFY